jgi:hypothetical protein
MLYYALGKQIIQSNLSYANSSTGYLFWCSVVSGKTNHGIVLGSTSVCKSESTGRKLGCIESLSETFHRRGDSYCSTCKVHALLVLLSKILQLRGLFPFLPALIVKLVTNVKSFEVFYASSAFHNAVTSKYSFLPGTFYNASFAVLLFLFLFRSFSFFCGIAVCGI